MPSDTNIPAFARALAAIPKRLREGFKAHQHGRDNVMLIESEDDPHLFVGRLIKSGRKRFSYEAFGAACAQHEAADAKVIAEGRVTSPLRGITLARQFNAAHNGA